MALTFTHPLLVTWQNLLKLNTWPPCDVKILVLDTIPNKILHMSLKDMSMTIHGSFFFSSVKFYFVVNSKVDREMDRMSQLIALIVQKMFMTTSQKL